MNSYSRWKAKEYRDLEHWRNWLAEQQCVSCGANRPEIAHVGSRGYSNRCSDLFALPICAECHRLGQNSQHAVGKEFWVKAGLDRDETIREHHERYLAEIKRRPDLIAKFHNSLSAASRSQLIPVN